MDRILGREPTPGERAGRAIDKICRDAALESKMKLTTEQAMDLQHDIMDTALAIVALKRKDYSGDTDPFANFRRSAIFDVPAWKGCMIRLMDKLSRIYQITEAGAMYVKDEALMDTFCDSINYICILAGLVCEEMGLQDEWLDKDPAPSQDGEWMPRGDGFSTWIPSSPEWGGRVPYAGGGEDYDGEGTS